MKCIRCNLNMRPVVLTNGLYPVAVSHKEKGLFGEEIISSVKGYVCPKCGKIELFANEPEKFENVECEGLDE